MTFSSAASGRLRLRIGRLTLALLCCLGLAASLAAAPLPDAQASTASLAVTVTIGGRTFIDVSGTGFPARQAGQVSLLGDGIEQVNRTRTGKQGTFATRFRLNQDAQGRFTVVASVGQTTADATVLLADEVEDSDEQPPHDGDDTSHDDDESSDDGGENEESADDGSAGDETSGSEDSTADDSTDDPDSPDDGSADESSKAEEESIYLVPESIDSDGSTDTTAALLEFFASVPDGARVRFQQNGIYRVDGTLELRDRHGITIEGNASVIRAGTEGSGTRAHWRFVGGSGIAVRDMTIHGANRDGGTPDAFKDSLQWQHGVDLRGVDGFEVANVIITEVYGDCVYVGLGTDTQARWSRNVVVRDNICARNGRQGMAVVAGRDVRFERNWLSEIGLMPFDIEPNGRGDGAKGITIVDNEIGKSRQWFFGIVGQGPVEDVTILNNRLRYRSMSILIKLDGDQRVSNVTIQGNVSDTAEYYNPDKSVISVYRVDGLRVTNNSQPAVDTKMVFVHASESCDVVVRDNHFPNGGAELQVTAPAC